MQRRSADRCVWKIGDPDLGFDENTDRDVEVGRCINWEDYDEEDYDFPHRAVLTIAILACSPTSLKDIDFGRVSCHTSTHTWSGVDHCRGYGPSFKSQYGYSNL